MRLFWWFILFMMVVVSASASGKAHGPAQVAHHPIPRVIIASRTDNMLNSLVSILRTNVSDIAEVAYHFTPDKKAFLRLFPVTGHNRPNLSEPSCHTAQSPQEFLCAQQHTAYYIYRLHKIVI